MTSGPLLAVVLLATAGLPVLAGSAQSDASSMFPPLAADKAAGWKQYATLTEQRIASELRDGKRFLAMDFGSTGAADRQAVLAGQVPISQMLTKLANGSEMDIPDGWAHHWRGAVLLRGVRLDQVFRRLQEEVPGKGKGDVIDAKIIGRDGTHLRTFIKLRRTGKVLPYDFVYDTYHDVVFTRRTPIAGTSTSVATRLVEMYHPGLADQRELRAGEDNRLLERWNSYWRYEEVKEGVIAECESITLSRRGPLGIGRGFADGTAQESMEKALGNLREFFR